MYNRVSDETKRHVICQ